MVLDLGLPAMDGLEVLRRLRETGSSLPVVVLTARDAVEDTVRGFEHGADDYVVKPFRFEELLVRVRARLRVPTAGEPTVLRRGALELDLRSRRATARGVEVELTAREFGLLETFLRHPDQVLSQAQLLSQVWGVDYDPGSNVVEVYVRYLRRKLGSDAIETVRGMGYRLP
jgi:DNA-binding response OmpR family regulator